MKTPTTCTTLLGTSLAIAVGGAASAQVVGLESTFGDFDLLNTQTLSNQSSSGFTATLNGAVQEDNERPRVFQTFDAIDFSTTEIGSTIALQFDIQFSAVPSNNDTDFRFGLLDTTTNSGLVASYDLGIPSGSNTRFRFDDDLTEAPDGAGPNDPVAFVPGDFSNALSASGTLGINDDGFANGLGVSQDTSVTSTFELLITRVEGGIDIQQLFRNDAPEIAGVQTEGVLNTSFNFATASEDGNTNVRTTPNINSIDGFAISLFDDDPFGNTNDQGSYTVSNLAITNLGLGDVNLDGTLSVADVDALLSAVNDTAGFQTSSNLSNAQLSTVADFSGNGAVDLADRDALLQNVFGTAVGDLNLDGDVDVFEFTGGGDAQVLTANLGVTTGATYSQGDINGDGDVDVFQFDGGGDAQVLTANLGFSNATTAAALVATSADAAVAGTASGTYDPTTGIVVLDIGEGVGVVGIEALNGAVLNSDNLSDSLEAAQITSTIIAFFDPTGLDAGIFDLGAIATPGTDVADLGFSFTPIGSPSVIVALTVVPEPTSVALLGLGGLALATRRRRRTA